MQLQWVPNAVLYIARAEGKPFSPIPDLQVKYTFSWYLPFTVIATQSAQVQEKYVEVE